jgi:hypothetical protein
MNLDLSPESEAWLRAQVQQGHFATLEEAIEYTTKLDGITRDPARFDR